MNRSSYTIYNSAAKSTPAFSFQELFPLLSDFSSRRKGKEIKLKVDGDVYVLSPEKGVYTGSAGSGTIARLLRSLNIRTSSLPLAPRNDNEDARRFAEMQRRIREKINDSRPLLKTERDSLIARLSLQKIVSDYLVSRGLNLELLPEDARVREDEKGFVELVLPLSDNENARSIHVTALDDNGKHGLEWTGGDCRYSLGPISGQFSVIDGATEQLKIKGKESIDWIAVAEGLETAMSIRLLTGWTTIFALNAGNLEKIFTEEMAKNMVREGKGLAISVDRDTSGAGQKAAGKLAAIAREAGIPVLFLVPPSVVKGSEKGADWNDAIRELGRDGALGALKVAILRSEEELNAVELGKSATTLDFVSVSDHEPVRYNRIPVSDAESTMYSLLKRRFHEKSSTPEGHAFPTGLGKSATSANLARDNSLSGRPGIRLIAPTKALANELASNSGGFAREGRSGEENAPARCEIFPEIEPFSEKWRSIVAHKCASCTHGKAAMATIKGETPDDPYVTPCQYVIHTNQSKSEPVVATTAAMAEGDPSYNLIRIAPGKTAPANVVLDDHSKVDGLAPRGIRLDELAEWVRAGERFAHGKEDETAKDTLALVGEVRKLAKALSENLTDELVRLAPADWTQFSEISRKSTIKLLDGTTLESIDKDREGKLEIPLRSVRKIGIALERGTAWIFKGQLFYSVPNQTLKAIQSGATVEDATPGRAVQHIIRARGGEVHQVFVEDNLHVCLVLDGGHGRVAVTAEQSKTREQNAISRLIRAASENHGAENVCVLTHKPLAEEIQKGFEAVETGWFGYHNRGQNAWKEKKHLIVFGVPQLSPALAERLYESERAAVLESGGDPAAWPEWDGTREEKLYRIPGQKMVLRAEGYKNEAIDEWYRLWTTAEVVQGIGRLRSIRRPGEELSVEIHSTFPFAEAYGLEFSEVVRGANRTMSEYHEDRKRDQIDRAIIAASGDKVSFRKLNQKMKELFGKGISARDFKELAAVTRQDIASIVSGNTPSATPDFLGKDLNLLVEKLEEWAKAGDPRDLVAMTDPTDDGWTPVEQAGLLVLHAVFRDEVSGGLPDPVPLPEVG